MDLSEISCPRVLNGDCSNRLREIQWTFKVLTHFEETSDIFTTYMGKLCPTGRNFEFENQIFVSGNCTSQGALMDKTPMRVLFDTGASKSYMDKPFYMTNTSLHTLPKFSTTSKGTIVGNIVSKLGEHFTFYHSAQEKASSGHGDEVYFRAQTSQHLGMGISDTDLYTWLEPDDPHRHQSGYQILKSKVDLKESALTPKEKTRLMHMIMKYKQAFSIRDKTEEYPNIKADM